MDPGIFDRDVIIETQIILFPISSDNYNFLAQHSQG